MKNEMTVTAKSIFAYLDGELMRFVNMHDLESIAVARRTLLTDEERAEFPAGVYQLRLNLRNGKVLYLYSGTREFCEEQLQKINKAYCANYEEVALELETKIKNRIDSEKAEKLRAIAEEKDRKRKELERLEKELSEIE